MKTIDQFSRRVLVICAGVCMILVTNALLPSSAKAEKKSMMSSSNTIFMGIDNGYTYYLFMPDGGDWSFEKMPLTKAKTATW
jgi:hypothetical protein